MPTLNQMISHITKKMFTGYNLLPEKTTSIQSMEIIVLKSFLTEVLGAVIV